MSISTNSLKASDVTVTPIKLKYSSSYDSSSINEYGIKVYIGVNEPIGSEVGYSEEAMVYLSAKHLYYSNYVSSSFPTTASSYDNWLQSTSALGTIEADNRYFPTGSYEMIQVLSIPRQVFGERISRRSFRLQSSTYNLVDDGNGNIWDIAGVPGYLLALYFESPDEYFQTLTEYSNRVGNIFYAQGMVVITNQDYINIFGNIQYLLQEDDDYLLTEDSNYIRV